MTFVFLSHFQDSGVRSCWQHMMLLLRRELGFGVLHLHSKQTRQGAGWQRQVGVVVTSAPFPGVLLNFGQKFESEDAAPRAGTSLGCFLWDSSPHHSSVRLQPLQQFCLVLSPRSQCVHAVILTLQVGKPETGWRVPGWDQLTVAGSGM